MTDQLGPILALWRQHKAALRKAKDREHALYAELRQVEHSKAEAEAYLRSLLPLLHRLPGGSAAMQQAEAELAAGGQGPTGQGPTGQGNASATSAEDKGQVKPDAYPDKGQAKPSAQFDLPGPIIAGVDPPAVAGGKKVK